MATGPNGGEVVGKKAEITHQILEQCTKKSKKEKRRKIRKILAAFKFVVFPPTVVSRRISLSEGLCQPLREHAVYPSGVVTGSGVGNREGKIQKWKT